MFYVYEWYNIKTNEIFYVGKGSKNRYKQVSKRNQKFREYYENNKCATRIIKYFDDERDALAYERKRILELKKVGQSCCNLDNGGTGGVNFIWTDEMREYKSIFNPMKRQEQRKRMSINNPMKDKTIAEKVGKKHRKTVIYQGEKTTCSQIAKNTGFNIDTIRNWCKRGYDIEGNPCYYEGGEPTKKKNGNSKPVLIDGIYFPSLRAAASSLGIKDSSPLCKALKAGKQYKGHECQYVNQQPSEANSNKSSFEGSETNR